MWVMGPSRAGTGTNAVELVSSSVESSICMLAS